MGGLYMMAVITNRNMKERFKNFFEENGQAVFFETPGRGNGQQ